MRRSLRLPRYRWTDVPVVPALVAVAVLAREAEGDRRAQPHVVCVRRLLVPDESLRPVDAPLAAPLALPHVHSRIPSRSVIASPVMRR